MSQTPMMRQWAEIKRSFPDCVVLFRLGDFYEAFAEDAEVLARVCDVTLTSRPVSKGERIPMAGVPYHAVDGYIAQLVRSGVKVAIAEQSGGESSPEKRARMSRRSVGEAQAGGGRALMGREVVRVVTPGTLLEGDLLDATANNYLAVVAPVTVGFGLAHADLTTGEFHATEVVGADAERRLCDELARLRPAEVLLPDAEVPGGGPLAEHLRVRFDVLGLPSVVASFPAWRFDPGNARRELLEHFGVRTLAAYGVEDRPAAAAAAGALVAYARATQQGAVAQLAGLSFYGGESYMALDASTRRNLELVATIRGDTRRGTLLSVMDATLTAPGSRLLRRWLDQPLRDRARIERRLDGVDALHADGVLRAELRRLMQGLPDLERLAGRIVAGYGGPREARALARGLAQVPAIHARLAEAADLPASLSHLAAQDVIAIADEIGAAIADDPPATLGTTGAIRPGHSAELDGIHASVAESREWIAALEPRERERTGIRKLKVGYNRVFGYYISVPKSQADAVPPEYDRRQTTVDDERYVTPELREREVEVASAEERILALERELFAGLVQRIEAAAPEILAAVRDVATLDALAGLAETAVRAGYVRPQVDETRDLEIVGGRHPVVERELADRFVPNDLAIREGEIILLTGPNMAGKSTVGRQAALIALMAQVGSFVPAASARVGLIDRIFTRIGAQDEIAAGQSTFMVEMVETAVILHHATDRSLVVLDELGRGTSTYDGMAIAWAVVEHVHNHPRLGARTLFATHYHELTALADILPRVRNYHLAVAETEDGIVFLHRVEPGAADRSYGVHVAELAGLPRDVTRRAWEILARLEAEGHVPLQPAEDRPATASGQLPLFAPAPSEHPVLGELRSLDVHQLTPLEALVKLYELQRAAGTGEGR